MNDDNAEGTETTTDWPDYDVPVGAIADNEGATPRSESPAATETTPEPTTPAVAATPAVPATGAPGTGTTQPPASQPELPPYRIEEILQRENRVKEELAAARAEIERLKATPPPAATATPPATTVEPPDPQTEAIRNRLLEVFPELKRLSEIAKLADRTGDIDLATEAGKNYRAAEQAFYDRHTDTQLTNLQGLAAAEYGKKVEELPEMVKQTINFQFGRWVHADQARVARYNALDTNLVTEFWPIFKSAMLDPVRRSTSAGMLTAAGNRSGLPVGGSTASPVSPASTKPPAASDDEDAIHARGWDMVRTAAGG